LLSFVLSLINIISFSISSLSNSDISELITEFISEYIELSDNDKFDFMSTSKSKSEFKSESESISITSIAFLPFISLSFFLLLNESFNSLLFLFNVEVDFLFLNNSVSLFVLLICSNFRFEEEKKLLNSFSLLS